MRIPKTELDRLIDRMADRIADQYQAAINESNERARIAAMEDIIAGLQGSVPPGAIDAVLIAAGVRIGGWALVTEAIRAGYHDAGLFYTAKVPGRYGAVFDLSSPRADTWIKEQSSRMITNLTDTQRDVVKAHLFDGIINGRNPRAVALDIVGRVGSAGRTGGIIGLNQPQLRLTQDMRAALSGKDVGVLDVNGKPIKKFWIGDDGKLKSVYTRRDRRFDGTILKAIQDGTSLPKASVDRLVSRYSDRLLELRGSTIGRTEALSAMNASQYESLKQVVDNGYANEGAITRIWHHSHQDDPRSGHEKMEGQPRGLNEPFVNPDTGIELMYPNTGPASESINCRCKVEHKVDFIALEGG